MMFTSQRIARDTSGMQYGFATAMWFQNIALYAFITKIIIPFLQVDSGRAKSGFTRTHLYVATSLLL